MTENGTVRSPTKNSPAHEKPKGFDIDLVAESLELCIKEKENIPLHQYLVAYKELLKFFQLLGSVFGFVSSDIASKIEILDGYRKDDTNGTHYDTLQGMIRWETDNTLLKDAKRPSGARTFLRLHRALEFLEMFMAEMSQLTIDSGTASCARDCYHKSLAKHHPWYIRKSASLALYALPSKKVLIERAFSGQENGVVPQDQNMDEICTQASAKMLSLSKLAANVFALVEEIYKAEGLLDLP